MISYMDAPASGDAGASQAALPRGAWERWVGGSYPLNQHGTVLGFLVISLAVHALQVLSAPFQDIHYFA